MGRRLGTRYTRQILLATSPSGASTVGNPVDEDVAISHGYLRPDAIDFPGANSVRPDAGAAGAFRRLHKGAKLNFFLRPGANMSTDGKISPSIAGAVQLARVRMDEMFKRVGASLPSDVQRELSAGVEAILVDVLSRHPAWRHDTRDFLSIAEAATLLFVSRTHISKLMEQGKLELHHQQGSDRFVTKVSVLEYWAARQAAVQAYNASTSDEK